jgi:hypothetical protein
VEVTTAQWRSVPIPPRSPRALIEEYLEPHSLIFIAPDSAGCACAQSLWIRTKRLPQFTMRDVRKNGWKVFNKERDQEAIIAAMNLLAAHSWISLGEKSSTARVGARHLWRQ